MCDGARKTRLVRGRQEREAWKLKGEDGKEVVPEAGKNFVLVPPPLLIPRAPITITVGGGGGAGLAAAQDEAPAEGADGEPEAPAPLKESSFVGQGKVLFLSCSLSQSLCSHRTQFGGTRLFSSPKMTDLCRTPKTSTY